MNGENEVRMKWEKQWTEKMNTKRNERGSVIEKEIEGSKVQITDKGEKCISRIAIKLHAK